MEEFNTTEHLDIYPHKTFCGVFCSEFNIHKMFSFLIEKTQPSQMPPAHQTEPTAGWQGQFLCLKN